MSCGKSCCCFLTHRRARGSCGWRGTVLVRIRLVLSNAIARRLRLLSASFNASSSIVRRGAAAVDRIASREGVRSMAVQLTETGDASPFVTEAETLAQEGQLDFLEIIGPDGKIVSSAQWPARLDTQNCRYATVGYIHEARRTTRRNDGARPLCGAASTWRRRGSTAWRKSGWIKVSCGFAVAAGMQICLYNNFNSPQLSAFQQLLVKFDPERFICAAGKLANAARYQSLIDPARNTGKRSSAILYLTDRRRTA